MYEIAYPREYYKPVHAIVKKIVFSSILIDIKTHIFVRITILLRDFHVLQISQNSAGIFFYHSSQHKDKSRNV